MSFPGQKAKLELTQEVKEVKEELERSSRSHCRVIR